MAAGMPWQRQSHAPICPAGVIGRLMPNLTPIPLVSGVRMADLLYIQHRSESRVDTQLIAPEAAVTFGT